MTLKVWYFIPNFFSIPFFFFFVPFFIHFYLLGLQSSLQKVPMSPRRTKPVGRQCSPREFQKTHASHQQRGRTRARAKKKQQKMTKMIFQETLFIRPLKARAFPCTGRTCVSSYLEHSFPFFADNRLQPTSTCI